MSRFTNTLAVFAITVMCISSVFAANKYGRVTIFSEADFEDWQVYISEEVAMLATSNPLKSKLIYRCIRGNETTCNFSYSSPYSRITIKSADIEFKFNGSKYLYPARIENSTALASITLGSELLNDFMGNNAVDVSLYDTDTRERISRDTFSLNGAKEALDEFLNIAVGSPIQQSELFNQNGTVVTKAEW